MLSKRRFYIKWISIIIAYFCIFVLSYELGTSYRKLPVQESTVEPRHLTIKRLFQDHGEYANSSAILKLIGKELKQPLPFHVAHNINKTSIIRHGLVVFYDYSYHHLFFQQFLWLYSSWIQLRSHRFIQNDLIVFVSAPVIPNDFQKLINISSFQQHNKKNQLLIYPCTTLMDSLLDESKQLLTSFPLNIQMELIRLFYWQHTRFSSLLIFLIDKYRNKLLQYDHIFRLEVDSFLMPNFRWYQQTSSLALGDAIPYDKYTLNRLERIQKYFHSTRKCNIRKQYLTISWFAQLNLISKLTREIMLMATWLIKEEFTDSERLHHLTYLNYPAWYIDGIFEYATAMVLSLNEFDKFYQETLYKFDCRHSTTNCFHVSFRDPSHHLHLSKHSLRLLSHVNRHNLTKNELYIYRTIIKANGMFTLYFSVKEISV